MHTAGARPSLACVNYIKLTAKRLAQRLARFARPPFLQASILYGAGAGSISGPQINPSLGGRGWAGEGPCAISLQCIAEEEETRAQRTGSQPSAPGPGESRAAKASGPRPEAPGGPGPRIGARGSLQVAQRAPANSGCGRDPSRARHVPRS